MLLYDGYQLGTDPTVGARYQLCECELNLFTPKCTRTN